MSKKKSFLIAMSGGSGSGKSTLAVALLERLGSRVQLLHIKDGPLSTNDLEQVAVGSGSMPVPAILAAAPQAIRVVELDDFDGDMLTAVADSAAYLVGLGERL